LQLIIAIYYVDDVGRGGGACIFGIEPQVIQNDVDGGCGHFTMTIRPKWWLWGKDATTLSGIAGEI
jgi:hypothetical protein